MVSRILLMGRKYKVWKKTNNQTPQSLEQVSEIIFENRNFSPVQNLEYGDYGLEDTYTHITDAIKNNKKIALYGDYDVDGTMSCVSWIWFLEGIGYKNYTYYIPDRFKEGYGVNLNALKHLVHDRGAQVIITMDTGITANKEAAWCKENNVTFICTDHHKIQKDKMPDCIILNPKAHPDPMYQELCGCGITFVLLRKLSKTFPLPPAIWTDILALAGMATICDIVPLNGVNHKLAQMGIQALLRSQRPVFKKLLKAASILNKDMDEKDIGFKLGPRINAVGRLKHGEIVVKAFTEDDADDLIHDMGTCNEKRKAIQHNIVEEAVEQAKKFLEEPILFLGGDWHQGVVGIAASKLSDDYWKPTWLFQRTESGICKGSARTIPGFDVTDAMSQCGHLFEKFGGHKAAGGFSFSADQENAIRTSLNLYAQELKKEAPELWESSITYDCELPLDLLEISLTDYLDHLRPYGHCFEEPLFLLKAKVKYVNYYKDKKTGQDKHTAITIETLDGDQKIMFFNEVHQNIEKNKVYSFLVHISRSYWRGEVQLSLMAKDLH